MSSKLSIVSWIITGAAILCVFIQHNNVVNANMVVSQGNAIRLALESYVVKSFRSGTMFDECRALDICNAHLSDSTLVMYLPNSLCRACFSSLLFSIQDNNFPFRKVIVLSENEDIEIKSECLSRGIRNIVLNYTESNIDDIIITCLDSDGQPSHIRYNIGDEYIVKMFLSYESFKE